MNNVPDDIEDNRLGHPTTPIYDLYDTDKTTQHVRPRTLIESLMEHTAGIPLQESYEEKEPLIHAVRNEIIDLDERQRYILNAVQVEGLSFAELGQRMGLSTTHTHRLYHQALQDLKDKLMTSDPVRYHIGLPPTWENGAREALYEIQTADTSGTTSDNIVEDMRAAYKYALGNYKNCGEHWSVTSELELCGRRALDWLNEHYIWNAHELIDLLAAKHHDYGSDNINEFGIMGILMRISDKLARLENLNRNGANPHNESIIDSYKDIIGYCVIGIMLHAGTFNLPLSYQEINNND